MQVASLVSLQGQIDTLTNVGFKDLTPEWIHIPSHSFVKQEMQSLEATFHNGFSDIRHVPLVVQDYMYLSTPIRQSSSSNIEGSLIEKVDLRNGELLWQTALHTGLSGREEYLVDYYINNTGQLELLSGRLIEKEPGLFPFFGFVTDSCQFSTTKLDTETGELISQSDPSSEAKITLNGDKRKSIFHPSNEDHYLYTEYIDNGSWLNGYNGYTYKRYALDTQGVVIGDPSCYNVDFPAYVDSTWTAQRFWDKIHQHSVDTTVVFSYVRRSEDDDESLVKLTLLDSNLEEIKSTYLQDQLPYVGALQIIKVDENFIYVFAIVTETNSVDDKYNAIYIFDYDGNLITPININSAAIGSSSIEVNYNAALDEFILMGFNVDDNISIDFFITNDKSTIELRKTISFAEDGAFLFPKHLSMLSDGDLLCKFHVNDLRAPIWMKISFEELVKVAGLNIYQDELVIYPNPTFGKITLNNQTHLDVDILSVFDFSGQEVWTQKVVGHSIDLSLLPSGMYILYFRNSSTGAYKAKKLQKM